MTDFMLTNSQVQDVVQNPEKKEIFMFEGLWLEFFYKSNFESASQDSILVIVRRDGQNLRVDQVFRLKPDLIATIPTSNLLKILEAFVMKFGRPMTIANETSKFFNKKTIANRGITKSTELIQVQGSKNDRFILSQYLKVNPTRIDVALGYCIDRNAMFRSYYG